MISNHTAGETAEEVLRIAREAGKLHAFKTAEPHVRKRLNERGATMKCLGRALHTAKSAFYQSENGRWRLDGGIDTDGDELTLIVEMRGGVVIVTLF